jgi:hypothetical protein
VGSRAGGGPVASRASGSVGGGSAAHGTRSLEDNFNIPVSSPAVPDASLYSAGQGFPASPMTARSVTGLLRLKVRGTGICLERNRTNRDSGEDELTPALSL